MLFKRKKCQLKEVVKIVNNKNIIIEQTNQYTTFYTFTKKNKKGESLQVQISEAYPDNTRKSSLPHLWLQHGHTNKLYNNYLCVYCYCTNKDGLCLEKYNPTIKFSQTEKKYVIDFDYLLEVSEKNKQYLLDLIYKMFMEV